jgi:hypothetical protein
VRKRVEVAPRAHGWRGRRARVGGRRRGHAGLGLDLDATARVAGGGRVTGGRGGVSRRASRVRCCRRARLGRRLLRCGGETCAAARVTDGRDRRLRSGRRGPRRGWSRSRGTPDSRRPRRNVTGHDRVDQPWGVGRRPRNRRGGCGRGLGRHRRRVQCLLHHGGWFVSVASAPDELRHRDRGEQRRRGHPTESGAWPWERWTLSSLAAQLRVVSRALDHVRERQVARRL